MTPLRARARTACEIARVDPDRFNEWVAAGIYPCAPRTRPGATRIFDEQDLITLCIFRHLTDEGMIPSKAGEMVCELRTLLIERPDAMRVVCLTHSFGGFIWIDAEHYDPADDFIPAWGNARPSVVSAREWRLRFLRQRIAHELAEAAGVVGED